MYDVEWMKTATPEMIKKEKAKLRTEGKIAHNSKWRGVKKQEWDDIQAANKAKYGTSAEEVMPAHRA